MEDIEKNIVSVDPFADPVLHDDHSDLENLEFERAGHTGFGSAVQGAKADTALQIETDPVWNADKALIQLRATLPDFDSMVLKTTVSQKINDIEIAMSKLIFDEAPIDGRTFVRSNRGWIEINTDPPIPHVVYGVLIDETNPDPAAALTYTDDAAGMAPGGLEHSIWDDYPIFKDIKPCVFKNGEVVYYLNKDNYTLKEDGTASVLTGADGDVMVEFPKIGWKFERTGNFLKVQITNHPNKTGFNYYAFTRDIEGDRDKLYLGVYNSLDFKNAPFTSKMDRYAGNGTIDDIRNAKARMSNGYDCIGFYQVILFQCLYLIRFKSLIMVSPSITYGPFRTTGFMNSLGMNSGYTSSPGSLTIKVFGIEQPCALEDSMSEYQYSNKSFIDGILQSGTELSNHSLLIGTNNFNNNGDNYKAFSISTPTHTGGSVVDIPASGSIKQIMKRPIGNNQLGFIALEGGGTPIKYYGGQNFSISTINYCGFSWGGRHSERGSSLFGIMGNVDFSSTRFKLYVRLMYL